MISGGSKGQGRPLVSNRIWLIGWGGQKSARQRPWAIHRTTIRQIGRRLRSGCAGCRRRPGRGDAAGRRRAGAAHAARCDRRAAGRGRRSQGQAAPGPRRGGEHPQASGAREGGHAKYAVTKLARDIVNVGDNFQRAIDAIPAGAAEQDAALKSFLEGVTMTERELLNVLERHGIRRVQPMHEPFNPHLHQAVMELQRSDVPSGTIVPVFQAGFMIEDRVLRPAMVAVAKGGPKGPAPEGAGGGQRRRRWTLGPHCRAELAPILSRLPALERPRRRSSAGPRARTRAAVRPICRISASRMKNGTPWMPMP